MTPDYRILADAADDQDYAADVTARIRDRLLSLEIVDEAGLKSDALQLVLDDRDHRLIVPRKGVELRCYLGFRETGLFDMGVFVVDEVEFSGPPAQMTIRAKAVALEDSVTASGLTANLKAERSRSWHGVRLGAVVETIAAESGYAAAVDDSLADVWIPHVDQTFESDLNFLSRLAFAFDAFFKPAGGRLLFIEAGRSVDGLAVVPIHGPRSSDLIVDTVIDWRLSLPERQEFGRVIASYFDAASAQWVEVVAGAEGVARTLPEPYPDEEQAARAATAELSRIQRARASGSMTLGGNPLLMAETIVVCDGFRPELNGEWLVERAQHTLDDQGYRTSINFKSRGGASNV